MQPEPPALTTPPEQVRRDYGRALAERAVGIGDGREDVLLTRHDGQVAVDVGLDTGEEELDVVGVGHDDRPRSQHTGSAAQHGPAGMHTAHIVAVVPDGFHPVDVARLEGGVELGIGLGDGVDVRAHAVAPTDSARSLATTRTASAFARTSCTRTPHAPARAATTVKAAVASSRPAVGRGPESSASSVPRKDFRLAPTSSGRPSANSSSRRVSNAQLCCGVFAKPKPGSTMTCAGSTPAATTSSTRWRNSSHTSRTTSA